MSLVYLVRILIFFGVISSASCYLNLYLNTNETFRLLGIDYELYYVRNGKVNSYALSYNQIVHSSINELYFTWQSLRNQPQMPYRLRFNVSNPPAMDEPTTNISLTGVVPNKVSGFKVSLPCTGKVSAEVQIYIQLVIDIASPSDPMTLNFKRRKTCLKVDSNVAIATGSRDFLDNEAAAAGTYNFRPRKATNATSSLTNQGEEDKGSISTSTQTFYAAVGCTCAVIIFVALGVAAYYFNSQRGSDRYTKKMNGYDGSSSQALTSQSQTFLRPDTPNNASGAGSIPGVRRGVSPTLDLKPTDTNTVLSEMLIERKRISLGDLLLEGTFGRIYLGTLIGEDENEAGQEQEVFIKTVTDQARQDQVHLFLTESVHLKGLTHANLLPILGACIEQPSQPLVLYPFLQEGNMKKFLLKCRMSECGSRYTLNTQQLVYMATQIIRGVQYLHRKKLVHKDLATRNCMVDTAFVVRVTDNSLSRDLFPGDYNCLGDNENRPVKWMAIEALQEKRFSPASDVWAFGVTLWEMLTLGQQPYAEVDPFEMVAYLQEGYRIAKPLNCPDELFSLMACCWALTPDERPKFSQLLMCLQNFYLALGRYV